MNDHLTESFVRQRRNLMVITILLFASQLYDVTIPKLNLFGNEFDLHRDLPVSSVLWFPAFYWVLRYFQVLNTFKTLGFREAQRSRFFELLPRAALRHYLSENPNLFDMPERLRSKAKYRILQSDRMSSVEPDGYDVELRIAFKACDRKGFATGELSEMTKVHVPQSATVNANWRAWLYVIFCTSLFTEYVLPPLFFLVPVGQWAAKQF